MKNENKQKGFFWVRYWHSELCGPQLKKIIQNPEAYCRQNILKEDVSFTTTVVKVHADNKIYVMKRYNIKSFWHGIKRSIQSSRAKRCWLYGNLLQKLDINSAKPIAMMEKRWGPLRRQAYIINEYIAGEDGFKAIRKEDTLQIKKAQNTLELINRLHEHGLYHGDLNATNFIYKDSTPYIIDLDAMRLYKNKRKKRQRIIKDRKRFLKNWHPQENQTYFANWSTDI